MQLKDSAKMMSKYYIEMNIIQDFVGKIASGERPLKIAKMNRTEDSIP
jgi:hypothetical protein